MSQIKSAQKKKFPTITVCKHFSFHMFLAESEQVDNFSCVWGTRRMHLYTSTSTSILYIHPHTNWNVQGVSFNCRPSREFTYRLASFCFPSINYTIAIPLSLWLSEMRKTTISKCPATVNQQSHGRNSRSEQQKQKPKDDQIKHLS